MLPMDRMDGDMTIALASITGPVLIHRVCLATAAQLDES